MHTMSKLTGGGIESSMMMMNYVQKLCFIYVVIGGFMDFCTQGLCDLCWCSHVDTCVRDPKLEF